MQGNSAAADPQATSAPKTKSSAKIPSRMPEETKSKLNATDAAALDNLFSQLDENFKTSYDLSQLADQVKSSEGILLVYAY